MRTRRSLIALALGAALAAPAWSQQGTIGIIVPSGAGSAPDIIARIIGDELGARLKQPTVVYDRPGAFATIAASPPLLPPLVRRRSYGLRVRP